MNEIQDQSMEDIEAFLGIDDSSDEIMGDSRQSSDGDKIPKPIPAIIGILEEPEPFDAMGEIEQLKSQVNGIEKMMQKQLENQDKMMEFQIEIKKMLTNTPTLEERGELQNGEQSCQ